MCDGRVTAVAGVTDRIAPERTTVPTGTTIHGLVVVDHHTGHVINLLNPQGCQPLMAISVADATIARGGEFSAVCIGRAPSPAVSPGLPSTSSPPTRETAQLSQRLIWCDRHVLSVCLMEGCRTCQSAAITMS